jgi:hypothetical protein
VTFAGAATIETTIHMIDDYGKRNPVAFAHTEVAAALIGWCISRKVPMPMSADRKLELIGGSLALSLTMDLESPRDVGVARR